MRLWKKALLYAFLLWLLPFVVAFLIYPLRQAGSPFFETIMAVVLALLAVLFGLRYVRALPETTTGREIWSAAALWFLLPFVIDMFMFSAGPMAMRFLDFVTDVGLTYLIYPAVLWGLYRARFSKKVSS